MIAAVLAGAAMRFYNRDWDEGKMLHPDERFVTVLTGQLEVPDSLLAAQLQRGLDAAVADGSLPRLFQQRFGDLVRRHQLAQRQQLQLRNPLLPPATPLDRPDYWLVLEG